MIRLPERAIDSRQTAEIVAELLARRLGYLPNWEPGEKGPDLATIQIFVRYLQAILQRLNQAPEKNKLAFLDLLGIQLIPAQSARVPVVFKLSEQAADSRIPTGTQLVAPPPPESNQQIVFETERGAGLSTAILKEVISLWPGRDQYLDHSQSYQEGQPFQPFHKPQLQNTPHILYIAHDTLLALAGKVRVDVEFEFTQTSDEHLDMVWEYWDGEVWRGFKAMRPFCQESNEEKQDGTLGFNRSGTIRLESDCAEAQKNTVNGIEAYWIRGQLVEPLPPDPAQLLPEIDKIRLSSVIERPLQFPEQLQQRTILVNLPFRLSSLLSDRDLPALDVTGLEPDSAFVDSAELDLTRPFYPFGLQPQPGVAFYFSSEEIFSKPGARVQVYVQVTETPQDEFSAKIDESSSEPEPNGPSVEVLAVANNTSKQNRLKHTVSWEYWNGKQWFPLFEEYSNEPTNQEEHEDFTNTGCVELTIPSDVTKTTVNDREEFWLRVRLVSGGFGFKHTVTWEDANDKPNSFTYVITQPPALKDFRLGYTWQYGPFHPEHVLSYNDFQHEDRTYEATWPGVIFQPFKFVRDVTPALYLGFNQKLPVDRLNLYFDIVEQREEHEGAALQWEYWNGSNWNRLSVEDETSSIRVPGMVSFIAALDSQPFARFNAPLHWLRARLKEDGPPGSPTINNIYHNAVWAAQRQTIVNETLGASSGLPSQAFSFRQIPVLEGEQIEVRELAGARANVEWRILAAELFSSDTQAIQTLENQLGAEGTQTEMTQGPLRLRRDRNKRVTEVWVRWQNQRHLFHSGPNDRHYLLERARGQLIFGDGDRGKVPPLGAAILARRYRTGGGLAGNVSAEAISQVLGAIAGIETVSNPKTAEGGADAESLEKIRTRGPKTLRHRGRAISAQDYETLAQEASPAVAVARAIPTTDASGRKRPGWVTLLILPQSEEPRPWPSFGLREQVRKFIEARTTADLAAASHIYVTGPEYQAVDVETTIIPLDPGEAGAVEQRSRQALEQFFHPLYGGPNGQGWELGRDVFLSDVASVLENVEGLDYVKELALLLEGVLQRERVPVADKRIVVAGELRIKVEAG